MRRTIAALIVVMMGTGALMNALPAGGPETPSLGPLGSGGSPWTDTFDDTSKVYVPPGGLAGVTISGGAVRLETGHDTGWVASTVITCPQDFRYDLSPGRRHAWFEHGPGLDTERDGPSPGGVVRERDGGRRPHERDMHRPLLDGH